MEVVFDGYEESSNPVQECRWVIKCSECDLKFGCVGARALEMTLFKLTRGPCSPDCRTRRALNVNPDELEVL